MFSIKDYVYIHYYFKAKFNLTQFKIADIAYLNNLNL